MKFMKQAPNRNGNIPADLASGCTECSIEPVNHDFVPDGDYLLHSPSLRQRRRPPRQKKFRPVGLSGHPNKSGSLKIEMSRFKNSR